MKTRFSTLDICSVLAEINKRSIGMRLVNVYDIDSKTYLFKLAKPDLKMMLLVESGIRIHLSEFDWPKNLMPSGFAMKMRKHLRGRRLVSAKQLGMDRIIDLQFGSDEAAFHVFIELYDRGNIALTDHEDIILNLLRFRKDTSNRGEQGNKLENDDVRFAVHEPYPRHAARPVESFISIERLSVIMKDAKKDSHVKRVLNPFLPYGVSCIDHCLSVAGFSTNAKVGKEFVPDSENIEKLHSALHEAEDFLEKAQAGRIKGYIIQKLEKKSEGELITNVEFHPFLFHHQKSQPHKEFDRFNQAVDEFFSSLESQKNDVKALQRERLALRKLDNVRRDHESRLQGLRSEQDEDKHKAWMIENNLELVDEAIKVIRSAIANQIDWNEIMLLVTDAQAKGDSAAMAIKSLKLEKNSMVMSLSETSVDDDDDSDFIDSSDDESEKLSKKQKAKKKPVKVDIDLSLSAYANAQKYYNMKRQAAQKEKRTMDASTKAFKSAEKKTKQSLKEAAAIQTIQKARKVYWFEKFLWFISSENYLVLGGRDAQQNELLVKKYLTAGDVYVHADLHGATSCIIKNSTGSPVPPKTLNEAGTMAICHSAAWDAKVVTSAWWVRHDQVSKTAPSGEYLTTGSFLIRGKKNYLPPSYLVYGFGFLFKVDETCVWKHKGERKVRAADDEQSTVTDSTSQMEELEITSENDLDDEEEKSSNSSQNTNSSLPAIDESVSTIEEIEVHEVESFHGSMGEDNVAGNKEITTEHSKASNNDIENNDNLIPIDNSNSKETNMDAEESVINSVKANVASPNNDSDVQSSTNNSVLNFPDTVVKLQYQTDDKYNLSTIGTQEDDGVVFLGDSNPVPLRNDKVEQRKAKPRLSAKQRREQKKALAQPSSIKEEPAPLQVSIEDKSQTTTNTKSPSTDNQPALKRGQKKKLRKMKEKYKDQDEEDRKIMMEILQSANPPKEKKGKNKHDSSKRSNVKDKPKQVSKPQQQLPGPQDPKQGAKSERREPVHQKEDSDEEREIALKEEHLNIKEVDNILDSLTGIPAMDDVLLFAIPVCAPYNTMQNYKFKVKLTPGTGKKGKAAKTAISMFQASRDTFTQEKDHLRSVKDHDLSRNMPGKVKVSAPNLQKQKFKGKRR